jgi:RNA polymerase sigma-70 factor (ECF subfamily)
VVKNYFTAGATYTPAFAFTLLKPGQTNRMELQQLLKECKQGSITAQKYLFDRFATQMFILCRRYMKNDATAEEQLMNGFLKFFQTLERFEYVNDAATVAWIKKLMVNECLMELRKNSSFLQVATGELPEQPIDETALQQLSAAEIFKLITQLPPGYRTVFNLYEIEGFSHKEIAAQLSISEGTSKSQLSKAKQMLQQLLHQQNNFYARKIN